MHSLRIAIPAALMLALTACGGSGGGNPFGGNTGYECQTGTQVELANPQSGQVGVPTNLGQITIVANGQANNLYNTSNQWSVILTPNYGGYQQIDGGSLNLVSDPNGPHPYNSDFYYSSSIQGLPAGITWNAQLIQNNGSNCQPVPLGSFST
jgi:hypothetical protein